MATGNTLLEGQSVQNTIVLFGGLVIDGLDPDGDALVSGKLRDAGAPTEGSGDYLCVGARASETDVYTLRVLRGSDGHRRLSSAVANESRERFSVRPRNLPVGNLNYAFYTCAYVTGSSAGLPNISQEKFETFTIYATGLRDNNVTIVAP